MQSPSQFLAQRVFRRLPEKGQTAGARSRNQKTDIKGPGGGFPHVFKKHLIRFNKEIFKKQDESKKRIKSGFFDYKAHYADER